MRWPQPWVPRSLPEALPEGEEILWRGGPLAWPVAVHVFHIRKVAVYFAALLVWVCASTYADDRSVTGVLVAAAWVVLLALVAIGILGLFAWLVRRTTTYTVTSRRLILQYGVAFPMTLNLPFKFIGSAALRLYGDGAGDIPVVLTGGTKIAYPVLWPHARPWHLRKPQPMLRAVEDARRVAEILSRALVTGSGAERPPAAGIAPTTTETPDLPQPSSAAA
ncbi:photosynthetic complex putative assembly protein PuhB [Rhodoplanes roseus]|uniref:photosynthetic complex putative assembly protein PuhB n=1 Tax=Rhodoplanes roseus TaxID=29409 RepID=UPI001473409C|nr:photosynthetic complex putative assembly protein PuhB [Rhodoplanes roseus]